MKIEQFGSRKPEGIFQEFEAHLFVMNLVAIIGNIAQDEYPNNFNFVSRKITFGSDHLYKTLF